MSKSESRNWTPRRSAWARTLQWVWRALDWNSFSLSFSRWTLPAWRRLARVLVCEQTWTVVRAMSESDEEDKPSDPQEMKGQSWNCQGAARLVCTALQKHGYQCKQQPNKLLEYNSSCHWYWDEVLQQMKTAFEEFYCMFRSYAHSGNMFVEFLIFRKVPFWFFIWWYNPSVDLGGNNL